MGLEMYAYAVDQGDERPLWGSHFHCWRKHVRLLQWLESLQLGWGFEAWEYPATTIVLLDSDIDRLEKAVEKRALLHPSGCDQFRFQDDQAFVAKGARL